MVFNSLEDMAARIDNPDLDVTADDILVLQNAGPRSALRPCPGVRSSRRFPSLLISGVWPMVDV